MRNKNEIIRIQSEFVSKMRELTLEFVLNLDKINIQTVLLSGSVARGDFFPGEYGGMIDLIVMKKDNCVFNYEKVFGKDEDPEIPYHCVRKKIQNCEVWFEIDVCDFISADFFEKQSEAKKFSILESVVLYDEDDLYLKEIAKICSVKKKEIPILFKESMCKINSFLNPYIEDKWFRRKAFSQLHQNLDMAIMLSVRCLYYRNDSYVPPDNRILYYTYSLEKLPQNYKNLVISLYKQKINSYVDYKRRKNIFENKFLKFLKNEEEY